MFVAFSPERIDPANAAVHHTTRAPRRRRCHRGLRPPGRSAVLRQSTPVVHLVSSPEAAELCKLLENSFRAVNISLANEFADVARALDVDPLEVVAAAATKPYGFMPFYPGPGVGGHCIPCDPHYLRWQMRARRVPTPMIDAAMESISRPAGPRGAAHRRDAEPAHRPRWPSPRPRRRRGVQAQRGRRARVAGGRDHRAAAPSGRSPSTSIDPVAPELRLRDGTCLRSIGHLDAGSYDLVADAHHATTRWTTSRCARPPVVVDATYRLTDLDNRVLP